jgi:hypothetical protein
MDLELGRSLADMPTCGHGESAKQSELFIRPIKTIENRMFDFQNGSSAAGNALRDWTGWINKLSGS